MQTQVSILHQDYPAPVRDEIRTRLEHLIKFYDRIVTSRALVEKQRQDHRVEIVCNVGNGAVLVVDARGEVFSSALDRAFDRMTALLKRHNQKLIDLRRRSGRAAG